MKFPAPPRGLKAIPWRMPIWIYRLGLGGLMGKLIYLTKGLAIILGFIGVKLIVEALHGGDIHKIFGFFSYF